MTESSFDAIVVGSGISGGWAAKELTEQGLKVLMLDRGKNIEHITGYTNATKDPWMIPHRGMNPTKLADTYRTLSLSGYLAEDNADWWADDVNNPYIQEKPYEWIRGYHVGGRSLLWGRQSYRWSDFDFEGNVKDGIAIDWPIRYRDIEPWYDHVESFAGISGSLEGIPQLPDGKFLPPMEMTCVEKSVSASIRNHFGGRRHLIIGRVANITQPHEGRVGCQYRNKCRLGCPFGGYFSTQASTLPAAVKTGNLTLRPFSLVRRVLYDKDRRRATGVEVIDSETHETTEFRSRIVFLCASTFHSTAVLMNSATDVWPDGLGSACGELGHNAMDHMCQIGAGGRVDGYEDRTTYGRRANGVYVPRFRNLFGDKRPYLRGFGYQGGSNRGGWQRNVAELSIGPALKKALAVPGGWSMGLGGFGETLPYHDNRIYQHPDKKDQWGQPLLVFDIQLRENERLMIEDMKNDAAEMLEASGVKDVKTHNLGYVPGFGIHEMGTARMGRDPKTSVLNGHNQVWDARNVFVTDGSCMASAACVNPSLTYMALTARAAHFAVEEMNRGNL